MKINAKSVAKAVLILATLTVLPLVGRLFIPSELIRAFSLQGGFDLLDLLNRIAVIGIVLSILILLRGHTEKASRTGLVLSSIWKVFWLFIVFFFLGLGHPETLGLAVLGGKSQEAENSVVFDFRLIATLATVVVALMIVRSIIQFQDSSPEAVKKASEGRADHASLHSYA